MNTPAALIDLREIRHFHMFCGLGGGAKGFNRGSARVGNMVAEFRCIGGVDVDAAAIRDFTARVGVPGTVLDLFDRDQYRAFHGCEPSQGWRSAGPEDIQRAAGWETPHIVFLSAPCKGFSGLLSESRSKTEKYQALNRLTVRGVWLMLEAFANDPPELILFENVPRIATRGRALLDQIAALLKAYGYIVNETTHDCGELGALAQSRKRFLLVARHAEKVPPFLYEPPKQRLRAVGDVLGRIPLPGDLRAGPMHRMPSLQWQTWVRLAFVEAGSDWRSLNRLRVENGTLADYGIAPEAGWQRGVLGVRSWEECCGTLTGRSTPTTGAFSVADPRIEGHPKSVQMGVRPWEEPAAVVTGKMFVGGGPHAVADPRHQGPAKHNNCFRIVRFTEPSPSVTGGTGPTAGGLAVADPRAAGPHQGKGKYRIAEWGRATNTVIGASSTGQGAFALADPRPHNNRQYQNIYPVTAWTDASGTVIGRTQPSDGALCVADPRGPDRRSAALGVLAWTEASGTVAGESLPSNGSFAIADPRTGFAPTTHSNVLHVAEWTDRSGTVTGAQHPAGGAMSVADPRPGIDRRREDDYYNGGHFGVLPWDATAGAISAAACHDNGRWSVADPRLPAPTDRLVAVIEALDGTWHRPFTTFELAALQSLVDPEEQLELDGLSDSAWRERIGNAVPPDAAKAIADTMGTTLLLAWSGESFMLSALPIWVRPIGVALAVRSSNGADAQAV